MRVIVVGSGDVGPNTTAGLAESHGVVVGIDPETVDVPDAGIDDEASASSGVVAVV